MKSLVVKGLIVSSVIIGLLIPLAMVKSLIKERQKRRNQVIDSMGTIWGKPQIIKGIYLSNKRINLYPEKIKVTGTIKTDIRQKGIFKIPFYRAELEIHGIFANTYSYRSLYIDATDASKITVKKLIWNGKKVYTTNGSQSDVSRSFWLPPVKHFGAIPFKIVLSVKGLDKLHFLPLARRNSVSLSSNWSDPSFSGAVLPDERTVNSEGFSAKWEFKSNSVSRDYYSAAFGVGLFLTNSVYTQTDRAIKYGILFIALTFLAFLLFELINTIRIHPFQYSMVGLSLVLFYLLLLSFSEHIHFYAAYFVSAIAIIGTITSYSNFVLKTKGKTAIMGVLLSVLYLFLFVLLQLEDYALLLGSVSLFAILAGIMFITRNIDWYELQEKINRKFEHKNQPVKTGTGGK